MFLLLLRNIESIAKSKTFSSWTGKIAFTNGPLYKYQCIRCTRMSCFDVGTGLLFQWNGFFNFSTRLKSHFLLDDLTLLPPYHHTALPAGLIQNRGVHYYLLVPVCIQYVLAHLCRCAVLCTVHGGGRSVSLDDPPEGLRRNLTVGVGLLPHFTDWYFSFFQNLNKSNRTKDDLRQPITAKFIHINTTSVYDCKKCHSRRYSYS